MLRLSAKVLKVVVTLAALAAWWAAAETALARFALANGPYVSRDLLQTFLGKFVFYSVATILLWVAATFTWWTASMIRRKVKPFGRFITAGVTTTAVVAAAALFGYFVGYNVYKKVGGPTPIGAGLIGGATIIGAAAVTTCVAAARGWARRRPLVKNVFAFLGWFVLVAGLAAAVGGFGYDRARVARRPNVTGRPDIVLITIDALRADAFTSAVTPNLWRYAQQRGVVFTEARTAATWTLPSFAAFFTGTVDAADERGFERRPGPGLSKTWARLLWDNGYDTFAVIKNPYLDAERSLLRGFRYYYHAETNPLLRAVCYYDTVWYHGALWEHKERATAGATSSELTTTTLGILARRTSRPKFVWVHYLDPHYPYVPRAEDLRAVAPGFSEAAWCDAAARGLVVENAAGLRVLYHAEARTTDAAAAPLLRALESSPRTLAIITADHGEEFGDHGHVTHGYTLYDELVRVPLIVVSPGGRAAGDAATVATPVSLVDIAPSVLTYLGMVVPPTMEGRSDLLKRGGPVGDRDVLMAVPAHGEFWSAVVAGDKKTIMTTSPAGPTVEYYDLARDPGERTPLPLDVEGERLKGLLTRRFGRRTYDITVGVPLPPGKRQELKALGYN